MSSFILPVDHHILAPTFKSLLLSHAVTKSSMDSVFLLDEANRTTYLQLMMQSFGCTYACLWSYVPHPSNCLLYLDGGFKEEGKSGQPSSSSGSLARRLFYAYSESVNIVDHNGRIPGFAFKNNLPYMELKLLDFRRMASSELQMQFYQEARIMTTIFMGCAAGEIELGFSTETLVDLEMQLKDWFPQDFVRRHTISTEVTIPQNLDQTQRPSSSSSSLMSLSFDDSGEHSPLIFNSIQEHQQPLIGEALLSDALRSLVPKSSPLNTSSHVMNKLSHFGESEEAVMTKAILAVLSSSSSQNLPLTSPTSVRKNTAFTSYIAALGPVRERSMKRHNIFKRSVSFFRNLNARRKHELHIHGNRPTPAQMHHVIKERRRREKLNDSIDLLRSLLPPGSKKDKASVLSSTTEYLSLLKSEVAELSKRNRFLEAQVSTTRESTEEIVSTSGERLTVEIQEVAASTSEARFIDLLVILRGECSTLELVIRIMEFLKQQKDVKLMSVESNTRSSLIESLSNTQMHAIQLSLKIEGDAFEKSSFQEAVRRVLDDLTH